MRLRSAVFRSDDTHRRLYLNLDGPEVVRRGRRWHRGLRFPPASYRACATLAASSVWPSPRRSHGESLARERPCRTQPTRPFGIVQFGAKILPLRPWHELLQLFEPIDHDGDGGWFLRRRLESQEALTVEGNVVA